MPHCSPLLVVIALAMLGGCSPAQNPEVFRFTQTDLPELESTLVASIGAAGATAQWTKPQIVVGARGQIYVASGFTGDLQWPDGKSLRAGSSGSSIFVGAPVVGGWVRTLTSDGAAQVLDFESSEAGDLWTAIEFDRALRLGDLLWSAPTSGRSAIAILKWSPSGAVLWSSTVDATHLSGARLKVGASGGAVFTANMGGYSPGIPDTTGSAAFGRFTLKALGDQDAVVAKLSPQGEWVWAKRFGARTQATSALHGVVLESGDVVVIGEGEYWIDLLPVGIALEGPGSAYLARLTADSGETRWITAMSRFVLRGPTPMAARGGDVVVVGDAIGPAGVRTLWPRPSDQTILTDSTRSAQASLIWLHADSGQIGRTDVLTAMLPPAGEPLAAWLADAQVLITDPGQAAVLISRWAQETPRSERYVRAQTISEIGLLRQSVTRAGWSLSQMGQSADGWAWDSSAREYIRLRTRSPEDAGAPNESFGAWLGVERLKSRP